MMIKTDKGSQKYSRRAILKRLGIGAGFLPLLSTERARGAAPNGFPTRFIGITWTDGICPPNFYPTGAAGPLPATLPSILQPLAAWSSKLLLMRSASKQQSPFDIKVMMDLGATYGGHFTYPALLTELAERAWSDADLEALTGGNILRVLQAAEDVAEAGFGA